MNKKYFFLTVVVCLFFVALVRAQTSLHVNETEIKAFSSADQLQINLAVRNDFQKNLAAIVRLEILDADDRVLSQSETKQKIGSGKNNLQIPLRFAETDVKKLLWYRLRYQINANGNMTSGIVALSEIFPEIFELRVSASRQIYAGMRFPARVRAFHPTKSDPISGVKISAELNIDLKTDSDVDELKIQATGETDRDGFAVLEFQIPDSVKFSDDWGGDIEVKGEKNNLRSAADEELRTENNQTFVYFITDKPLYQPNQKIYVRGLAMQKGLSDSPTIVADKEFEFSIKDEDDTVLYRQTVKTSRFGVAAIEWQIPENAKLGTYSVSAKSIEDSSVNSTSFKVSRYELPNFVVRTKPDKEFYLPEQREADVTVDALYLFGKVVASGKVKVVQEGERTWNYKEQKWDIEEEAVYEGEADARGKYIAKIDLSKAHASLKEDEDDYFSDLHFTAYFTDLSTNKTEQRRFDLRVTKEPIHIYLIGRLDDDLNPKLPLRFYVSTESANGDPVGCDIEIKGKYEDEQEEKTLASLKTNSLGMGKVEFFAPKRADEIYVDDLELKIIARDVENKTGTREKEIEIDDDEKQISVRTDKAIYRKGEPLKIEVISTEPDETVFLDISKNFSSIASRTVKLKNGRAELKIPYDPKFQSMITVSAYFDDEGDAVKDSHGIVYPTPRNLRVTASSDKEVFRPNEEAAVSFAVTSRDKKQTENALGIVILDKAVEERAKTDASFGGAYTRDNFQDFRDLAYNKWDEIDLKKAVSPEFQLFAEARFADSYFDLNFFDSDYEKRSAYVFGETTKKQFAPLERVLSNRFNETFEYPKDDASLRRILSQNGIDFDALRDPWNNSFKTKFHFEGSSDSVVVESAGANKSPGDADDFTALLLRFPHFKPTGIKIDKAVAAYTEKTGKFVRDIETLRAALREYDIDFDEVKDRWGNPYKVDFAVSGRKYTIAFGSEGDKKYFYDDFTIWTTQTDYFSVNEKKIEDVLNKFVKEKKTFPKDEAEFKAILKSGGIDFEALRDGWNRPLYLNYKVFSRFEGKVTIENVAKPGEKSKETISITPVTRQIAVVNVRSLGEDGKTDANYNWSDPVFSTFAGIISEQAKNDKKPKVVVPKTIFANGKSAIYGVIKDSNDAVIPNANVSIIHNETQAVFETKTNDEGVYVQTGLIAGKYTIQANSTGFKTSVVNEVKLEGEKLVEVNLTLEAGAITETVVVTAESSVTMDAADTKIDTNITRSIFNDLPSGTTFTALLKIAPNARPEAFSGGFQYVAEYGGATGGVVNVVTRGGTSNEATTSNTKTATPRLREYFPETLLWIPELVTDKSGKVTIKFRLADNITTWKIYAIASNAQGKVGMTEKEIKAFQPFFVDLEPPKFLTDGDEIFLPTQVRNYTPAKQKVDVTMARADWFSFLEAETRASARVQTDQTQKIEVNSNEAKNAVFGFKAIAPVRDGKQRVTAIADKDSDAIEKPVTVRPNGQEIVRTESKLFRASADFEINFPANALPKTPKAELKIYPNLMAHVTESVEGLLQRPYGCGEQTISSTYPNLMILKFVKTDNFLAKKAKIYLQKGYRRLLGYQVADGGFSYWGGKSESEVALTAYALRFLNDAMSQIEVDEKVIENAQNYLLKQQRADGSWTKKYYYETTEDAKRTKLFTSYVARTLAMLEKDARASRSLQAGTLALQSLQKALAYLKTRNAEIDEPYALALFALAAYDAGDTENAHAIAQKLRTMALDENGSAYWNLETNTPFYGWGTAGRIETTALVLQVLLREKRPNDELASKATMFLLKSKDRYGVWYSTQTTINVLDAFLASLIDSKDQTIAVSMNGEKLKDFTVSSEQIEPIVLDLNGKLANANRLEVTGSNGSAIMSQIVSTHYIDWKDSDLSAAAASTVNQSRQLRLDYKCDKQTAKIMEEINCAVETERVGFKGYGMLLAEIGLPPGADVSRESLEKALEADWSLSRYDILPDRIVLYMWSKAGGTKFNFKFKPRYGINAQTPASFVYDYYNEEAKATLAPMRFEVK